METKEWDNAATFHAIGSQSSPCRFGLEEEGLSRRSAYEDQAAKTAWKRKNSSCSDALVCSSGDSLRGISQSASQSDADQWPTAWMLYLWLQARSHVSQIAQSKQSRSKKKKKKRESEKENNRKQKKALKKKSDVAARQSVHPSERSPTLPSSSGLCVRQIENEQQSTVGEVSQPLKVMALASRLAGPDNAVPGLPGSDSWLSNKKKIRSLFPHVLVQSSYILDVVGTFWIWSSTNMPGSLLGLSRAFDFV